MRTRAWLPVALGVLALAALAGAQGAPSVDSTRVAPAPDTVAAAPAPPPAAPRAPAVFRQDVAWSPDGRQLAWSEFGRIAPDTTPVWSVWVATSAGTARRLVARDAQWVGWSPDGQRLVYGAERDGNWEVCSARLDGGDERDLTRHAANDRQPAWSPRGDRIAFVSDRAGALELFVMNADGSNVRQLTSDSSEAGCPQWSADGLRLAWHARDAGQRDRLHVMTADGASAAVVPTTDAGAIHPSFLPDGRLLYAAFTPAGRKQLTVVGADGTGQAVIGGIETFFARATRDGRRIAFIAGAWPRSRVVVARADGAAARIVAGDPEP